jgi:hypothetical protein
MVLLIAGDQVPEIPLFDTEGRLIAPPKQTGGICVNTGLGCGITTTVLITGLAHGCEIALGVNVYVLVTLLLTAGDHVPVIPLGDVIGNVKGEPEQIGPIGMKSGVVVLFTATVIIAVFAQGWARGSGVKVYKVLIVLSMAGVQVPLIPLLDVLGSVNDPPAQIGGTCVNVGV